MVISISEALRYVVASTAILVGLYASFLGLLTRLWFQAHVVYLHKIQMTWFKELNTPEAFGFLHNQVTPFSIPTQDGGSLFAWHILPVELYHRHEAALSAEPAGFVSEVASRLSFKLLRDDPEAKLVIHMHGAAGTVGSGYRVPNYRALSAGDTTRIHVLTFDYRGFGRSSGTPSESVLRADGISVANWAMKTAGILSSRILFYSQSLGTAVMLATLQHFIAQDPPVAFAGAILTAPFADAATVAATYRVAGTVPILSPLAKSPRTFGYLSSFMKDKRPSRDRIASYIGMCASKNRKYNLILIHAKDDYDIPWQHTEMIFQHAVKATLPRNFSRHDLEEQISKARTDLGAAGSVVNWRTKNGVIRKHILETGLHDVVMGYPVVSISVMRILEAMKPP